MDSIVILLISLFIGFAFGRLGDKYLGYLEKIWIIPVPHHWLTGIIFVFIGLFWNYFLGIHILSFGVGLFISDFNDFIHGRFFGEEPLHQWKFWSIE